MDTIETIDGALVQHGPHNDRIYLMHLQTADPEELIAALEELGCRKGYGKIFAKVPAPVWPTFESAGYVKEAEVPGLFNGRTDGCFIAKYLSLERRIIPPAERRLERIGPQGMASIAPRRRAGRSSRMVTACRPSDAEALSRIFRRVFKTYPFPVHQPVYLRRMMREGVRYFAIRFEGRIAAVAAAETELRAQYAEMTDFATLPEHRSRGLAGTLLRHMEKSVRAVGVKSAFTIARSASPGMNAVFRKNGYRYAGLLRNNTQIGGRLESMTVWYKPLQPSGALHGG
jgi:putative beta-lysine N-acetyltransferase